MMEGTRRTVHGKVDCEQGEVAAEEEEDACEGEASAPEETDLVIRKCRRR